MRDSALTACSGARSLLDDAALQFVSHRRAKVFLNTRYRRRDKAVYMKLQDIRIRNYRSIESQNISIGELTVLFGKNDSGKSNVVKALEFAFERSRQVDVSNVHVSAARPEPKETIIAVDVRFVGDLQEDIQWLLAFSEEPFNTDEKGLISLSFRTEAVYNPDTRTYEKTRRIINEWASGELGERLPAGLLDSIEFILLDAHRDISEVVRDRFSRWNQEVRKADVSDEDADEIEADLARLGASIVRASPFLAAAQDDLKGATDHRASNVEIAPVARNLSEMYRSLYVFVTEDAGPSISMSQFGAGTRSRAEFMAFKSLTSIADRDAKKSELPITALPYSRSLRRIFIPNRNSSFSWSWRILGPSA